jgi:hypothetical protein
VPTSRAAVAEALEISVGEDVLFTEALIRHRGDRSFFAADTDS